MAASTSKSQSSPLTGNVSHFTDTRAGYMIPNEEKAKRIALVQARKQKLRQKQKEALLERKARMFASAIEYNSEKEKEKRKQAEEEQGKSAKQQEGKDEKENEIETATTTTTRTEISSDITDAQLLAMEEEIAKEESKAEAEYQIREDGEPLCRHIDIKFSGSNFLFFFILFLFYLIIFLLFDYYFFFSPQIRNSLFSG